ncbi:MAG: hypothetical protein WA902_04630 [Thermosynechococcaceae cyanobacterium]
MTEQSTLIFVEERRSIQWEYLFRANVQGDRNMSSDQRYQSQLFNVILRQSRQLSDQWQRNTRQAKVASLWGLQMAIYPVYLLFQVTRLGEQILRQADTQGQRLLKAALDPDQSPLQGHSVDAPLRRVLAAIQMSNQPAEEDGLLVVNIAALKSRSGPIWRRYQRWFKRLYHSSDRNEVLRGVASDLDTRHLVLVTPDNEPLDVLTLEQQKNVLQLMTWEVAHYQRQQRLNHQWNAVTQLRQHPLSEPRLRSQMLPPIRGFRQLMGWFQTSPMATATNLFQEAQAVDPLLLLTGDIGTIPLPKLGETLRRLSPQLTPEALQMMDGAIAEWETLSWQVVGPTATDLSAQINQTLQHRQARHHRSHPSQPAAAVNSAPPRSPLAGWLQSALVTLFGHSISPQLDAASPQHPEVLPALSWSDLYRTPIQSAAAQPPQTPGIEGQGLEGAVAIAPPIAIPADRITFDEQGVEIEVDAVFVEYEQHTLERILNALDRVVSWLEKRLTPWLEQGWSVVKVYFQQLRQS